MSILAPLCLVAGVQSGATAETALLLLTAASIGIGVAARVIPPRKVSGPDRIPADGRAWPLLAVIFGALGAYLFAGALYVSLRRGPVPTAGGTMPPGEIAFMSTVPPLVALVVLLLGDRAIKQTTQLDLGLDRRRLPAGLAAGLWGALIVVPPLYMLSFLVEMVYRALRYEHPTEHPLLKVLGGRPGLGVQVAIVIGACIIAPIFEETFFRGHIQTLLRRALLRIFGPRMPAPHPSGFPVITPIPHPPVIPEMPSPPPRPTAWQTWSAILITSVLFALVHPAWSQPMIFILAVCLGYAYERTGNLWVSITIHATFNSVSTALYLSGLYSR